MRSISVKVLVVRSKNFEIWGSHLHYGNTLINFIIQRSHSIINVMIFRTFKHWYRVEEESVSLDAPVTTLDIPQERNYPVSVKIVLFYLSN